MPYHIDEENSELAFEVREGNKLVIKIKSNIFSDSLELYLIKVGDNTEPTDKNVFSSLRVLKEIENLHDTILKEINSVTSGFWELKQDSQGNEYISTKYNVLTEGGLTTYGLGEQKLGTIYDGLPIDNNTIYWEEVEGSRVLKAKGSGGEAGSVQWGNISGKPTWIEDTKPTYNWYEIQGEKPFYTKEEVAAKFVTIDTEQEITALKHFTAGLSVGESKKKIYEENGVVYIDADVAVTGAMTFYASAGRSVSTIMDGVTVDEETITKGSDNVLRIKNAGAGSSFDENAMWSALSGSSDNQINKSHLTNALAGYATESWVTGKGYATESWVASKNYATTEALNAVSNKLNDFLEGSDTDNIINKWKELEAFLSGMAETDNLAEILETKADKKYVDSTFVTLATKQTITGEKTFSSVLNTAAIKASGAITAPSLAVSDYVTIAGIKLRKLEDGVITLEGNLAVTGGITTYAIDPVSASTIMDGVVVDGTTIKKENGKLVAVGGGEAGSVAWGNISGKPSVFATNIANITDLHSSWDAVLKSQKPNWLTAVSIATISDLHANWDALLKAAPSAYVTRWPTISEVTNKQNLVIKLNGGTTEGTNQFTYNATAAKSLNITPAGIGAAASSHSHNAISASLTGTNSLDMVYAKMADNDYFRLRVGGTASNAGYVEFATADDGNEPIYFRQYTGTFTTVKRTLTLLDGSGNSSFPGTVTASAFDGNLKASNKTLQIGLYSSTGIYLQTPGGLYYSPGSGTDYKIWHAGNDGHGSELDSDTVDGTHLSDLFRNLGENKNLNDYTDFSGAIGLIAINTDSPSTINSPINYGAVMQLGIEELNAQFALNYANNILKYRARWWSANGGSWSSWKQIAFTDSNVASATKLQTARTLWGQSFDGTGNVSGNMTGVGKIESVGESHFSSTSYSDPANNIECAIKVTDNFAVGSNCYLATLSGNVGIGTRSPSYKLHVNGSVRSNGFSAGEYSDDKYGFYNCTRGNGSGTFSCYAMVRSGTLPFGIGYDSNNRFVFGSANTDKTINTWFAISNTTATMNGNILATGGCTFYGSDIRYKLIMQQVNLSLLDIAEAPSFVYRWNRPNMNQNRLNLGGSAQYTQSVLPWAVEDNDNFLSMDYATVAYTFAVHTARHLLTYETRTDKKIKKLENRVKYLEKQLKKLGYEEVRTLDDQSV